MVEKTKGIKITAAGAEAAETVGGANARRKSVEVDSGNETEEGVEGLDSRLEKGNANLDPEEGRTLEVRLRSLTYFISCIRSPAPAPGSSGPHSHTSWQYV